MLYCFPLDYHEYMQYHRSNIYPSRCYTESANGGDEKDEFKTATPAAENNSEHKTKLPTDDQLAAGGSTQVRTSYTYPMVLLLT
jgi:hypothetical protein